MANSLGTHVDAPGAPGWRRSPVLWLTLLAALIFALRLIAPPNLLDQDQERPAAYVLDVVKNANWICQRDVFGDVTSKPPLFTWVAAVITLAAGEANEFSLYLPGALATWGTALLVFFAGRRHFGEQGGVFAALAGFLCYAGFKAFGLARTDAVFMFTVTATALLGWRAWSRGRGWMGFWLMAGLATLTKGPLGLVLGASGLLAAAWEKRSGHSQPLRGSHWPGILTYLALTAGWFGLAYGTLGQPLIDKMLGRELVGHIASKRSGFPGSLFWQPPLYYLGRAAPWSVFAFWGLWRVLRQPAVRPEERRFERFLFCWFVVGIAIFGLSTHQRADLLWPLLPAASLLAGRELARWTRRWQPPAVRRATLAVTALILAGFAYHYFGPAARKNLIPETVAVRNLAREVIAAGGREFPLTHVDSPYAFQYYLNTLRPLVTAERAAALLRGSEPVFVAVTDPGILESHRLPGDPPLKIVLPAPDTAPPVPVRIVSNYPEFAVRDRVAFAFGDCDVRLADARLVSVTQRGYVLQGLAGAPRATFTNVSEKPITVRVRWQGTPARAPEVRTLAPGETWEVAGPPVRAG
ncbi:MAG: glycosyltransferase family 39 protein [Verrucomicrobia bacterium]|nr:glycosyltransferase family 39 protein [Verrucomicrobiota bacterium]